MESNFKALKDVPSSHYFILSKL